MSLQDTLVFLDGFFPELPSPVTVRQGVPAVVVASCLACRSLSAYQRAASSLPGRIVMRPDLADLETAGGAALLGHELHHQVQFSLMPDLERRYRQEERRTRGLPPYANGIERPAYEKEVRIYWEALARGFPPGQHIPLLVRDGLA